MPPVENEHGQQIGAPVLNWSARSAPSRQSMSGRYCTLESIDVARHATSLYESLQANPEPSDWTYLPYGPFQQYVDFKHWLEREATSDDPLFYAIRDGKAGALVGIASYLRIQPEVGVIEVGHIHFSPVLQKTPMATEAMFLMMQRVFDELGYRRYEWKCDALNARSRSAALRLGFQFEGIFRQATMYKNRNRDTAWFSIIDGEWPTIKSAFQTWLSPDNFDAQGNQRCCLSQLMDGN